MCDRTHPQDSFERSTYNNLVDSVLWNPTTKALYIKRLREVLAQYSESGWLEREVHSIHELIAVDARADAARWNTTGSFDDNVAALLSQIQMRRGQLQTQLAAQTPSSGGK